MTPLLSVAGASKRFGGAAALDGVSLTLHAGEAVAVVGENGAGKSTLMKIVAGVHRPDAGTVRLDGEEVRFADVRAAAAAGVALIHQELNQADNLTVAANLFLGREPTAGPLRLLRRRAMRDAAAGLLERVGLPAELAGRRVGGLPPGTRQLVEIARALGQDARVLIMDEPTSSLTPGETDTLYGVVAGLKAAGVGVLYISHRLAEVERIADRVVVLRDGRNAGELPREKIDRGAILRLMVGRELNRVYPPRSGAVGPPVLELRGDINLTVRAGEVLGMAGLVGAGRTELAEAVFGVRKPPGGVILNGEPLAARRPADAVAAGVVLVPEDRRGHGLLLEQGVRFNLSLPNLDLVRSRGLVSRRRERELADGLVDRLGVTPGRRRAGQLSGGNQQKVALGKWLARDVRVLILDEPTRGVDMGARAEVYSLIRELAGRGVAVWMISSDLEEVLGMSDRVAVMHEGRLAGVLEGGRLTEAAVMALATGGTL